MADTEWQNVVFGHGRLLSKAAAKETHLRLELEDPCRRSFTESCDPISSRYLELFAFCGMIASVMPTHAWNHTFHV
jgi:hypothetical protein